MNTRVADLLAGGVDTGATPESRLDALLSNVINRCEQHFGGQRKDGEQLRREISENIHELHAALIGPGQTEEVDGAAHKVPAAAGPGEGPPPAGGKAVNPPPAPGTNPNPNPPGGASTQTLAGTASGAKHT